MRTYVLRRLLQLVPLLLAVVVLTFVLLKLAPGDYLTTLTDNPQTSAATPCGTASALTGPGPSSSCFT
jgi:peptide/nickel transport system permease protein